MCKVQLCLPERLEEKSLKPHHILHINLFELSFDILGTYGINTNGNNFYDLSSVIQLLKLSLVGELRGSARRGNLF